jgi:hypothetical protein
LTVRAEAYQLSLRFPRLFPDPALFEDTIHLANRYLTDNGLSREKSALIFQSTEEILPVDDRNNPSSTSGTAKFPFEGKMILAEYMSNANVSLAYADFGTGLDAEDHSRLWSKGKIGELRFELHEFKHQSQSLNIPDIPELYRILKEKAAPNTLSTVELENVQGQLFRPVLAYVENMLRTSAKADGLELEIYAARDLSASERASLEKRLTRESGKDTIFIILSREPVPKPLPAAG